MTGSIHGLDKVKVGGSIADVAIDVTGSGHAGSDRLESSVGLAAINVIAGYRHAGLGGRRVPLQDNAMRLVVGR